MRKRFGCARCTVASLQDAIDFLPVDEGLFRTTSCLDGGATPTKFANCGSFTGLGMVIGWVCGTERFGAVRQSRIKLPTDFDPEKKFPEGLPKERGSDLSCLQGKTVNLKYALKEFHSLRV